VRLNSAGECGMKEEVGDPIPCGKIVGIIIKLDDRGTKLYNSELLSRATTAYQLTVSPFFRVPSWIVQNST
jgi:hypothetical protein